jgi:arylsulfatase
VDLAPTFYEMAQARYPDRFLGRQTYPLKGESLLPYLTGKTARVHGDDYVFALEHENHAMLRKGRWKITNIEMPFDEANFKLYDISKDLAELKDLKEKEPEVFRDLLGEWEKFSREIRVQIPPPGSE